MMPTALLVPKDVILVDGEEREVESTEVLGGRPLEMAINFVGGDRVRTRASARFEVARRAPYVRGAVEVRSERRKHVPGRSFEHLLQEWRSSILA